MFLIYKVVCGKINNERRTSRHRRDQVDPRNPLPNSSHIRLRIGPNSVSSRRKYSHIWVERRFRWAGKRGRWSCWDSRWERVFPVGLEEELCGLRTVYPSHPPLQLEDNHSYVKNQVNKRAKRGCRKWGKVPTIGRRGRASSSGGAKSQLAEIIRAEYVIIHI